MRWLLVFCVGFAFWLNAADFRVVHMGVESALDSNDSASTPRILLIAGIQGDESGGYNALDIFSRYYTIKNASVRVVPALNVPSMLVNNRGVFGDMNRKFAFIKENDPDAKIVANIKKEILESDAVFHLHDGSGFYRPKYQSNLLNPRRWGNCTIIDQEVLEGARFPNLEAHAKEIIAYINKNKLAQLHTYHLKNTHTRGRDHEMEKSLTFFAVENGVAAWANEASKELPLREKVYYHLLAVEGFLTTLGVEFERSFELNPKRVASLINDENLNAVFENLSVLPVLNLKPFLNYFPLPNATPNIESNSSLINFLKADKNLDLKYGNRTMSRISPLFLEFDSTLLALGVEIEIDGARKNVKIGQIVEIAESVKFEEIPNARINIIGFVADPKNPLADESGIKITQKDLMKKFSIDKKDSIFRAEIYSKEGKFLGMVLLKFKN